MKKEYQKPEMEIVSLVAEEEIASSRDIIEGDTDVESSIF